MKKNNTTQFSGYKINDYMLILNPHDELAERITKARNEFIEEFKPEAKLAARPNLAIAQFTQYEMMEERIINKLGVVAKGFPPFKVELKDFGSFPSHTIFINVTSKLPVQNLIKQVRTDVQSLMKLDNDNKPYFIMEPHITIGRKLAPWQYEKGWLKYSNKSFTGRFIADSVLLLKRSTEGGAWQIVRRFAFENLPVHTTQGELFG